ncbi:hypothetical protein BV20DRAFT_970422 [Pilatotrama ljubarskyi]|nr:hypothetical protein BV20DRAFT_970422 [Pilatotrama ljubarskyi]
MWSNKVIAKLPTTVRPVSPSRLVLAALAPVNSPRFSGPLSFNGLFPTRPPPLAHMALVLAVRVRTRLM